MGERHELAQNFDAKLPEILTQNCPKYMKLPEISTPYTNRGGQCPQLQSSSKRQIQSSSKRQINHQPCSCKAARVIRCTVLLRATLQLQGWWLIWPPNCQWKSLWFPRSRPRRTSNFSVMISVVTQGEPL